MRVFNSSVPFGDICSLASLPTHVPWPLRYHVPLLSMKCVSLSVWLALLRADRQTAGFSVNSMVSCALYTFGFKSPSNRHGSQCQTTKAGKRSDDVGQPKDDTVT